MVTSLTAPLSKALRQLEAEKQRIDHQISTIRAALKVLGDTSRGTPASSTRARGRRRMSVVARRAVSQRMKTYWAKRRAASAKSKARATQKVE